ncbi:MAG: glycosyltransferase family 4 protein [Saprospiraceae bacterium]|nr:glycosyltransferase family 4 protein [Saprospiraceae bacterium]
MNNNSLSILHVSTAQSWRGGEHQLSYLASELYNNNITQMILCPTEAPLLAWANEKNITHRSYKKRGGFDVLGALNLKKIVHNAKINIVHVHDAHAHTMAIIATILGMNVPIIITRKVDFPIKNSFFSIYKYNHPSIKKIICVSNAIKMICSDKIKHKNILEVIYDGIDIKTYRNALPNFYLHNTYHLTAEHIIVANIAAIAAHKDYHTFIETAKILYNSNKNYRFFIIGDDGGCKVEIEQKIKHYQLENVINIVGFRNDIPSILKEINVFLFTSKTEGLGSVLLEVMSAGVNIVSTNAGGISEILQDGVNALLANVGDAVQLADAVHSIINDADLAKKLNVNASKKVEQFNISSMANQYIRVYDDIIKKKNKQD